MRRRVGRLGLAIAVIAALSFAEARRRRAVPHLVTHGFNPLVMRLGLAGGRRSPWGIVEHVGRTSGMTYRTPISLLGGPSDDQVFVRLTYGGDVHWVRNVRATGGCRIQLHATILELDEPVVVVASENVRIPAPLRPLLDLAGRTYLRLHVVDRRPGTFTRPPEPAEPAEPSESLEPSAPLPVASRTGTETGAGASS